MAFNKALTAINFVIQAIKTEVNALKKGADPEIYMKEYSGQSGKIVPGLGFCQATKDGIIDFGFTKTGKLLVGGGGGPIKTKPAKRTGFSPLGKVYPAPKLTFAGAREIAGNVDKLTVGSVHADVKDDLQWKAVYGVKDRNLSIVDKHGTEKTASFLSCPCHNCGLILPMESIQVDHYMPQAGDEDLYTLKMLRALSLTVDAATGGKGRQVAAILSKTAAAIPTKGNNIGEYEFGNVSTPSNKWTTNDEGKAFLSLLGYNSDAMSSFKRICKNSVLNLAPLCAQCNKNKSDKIKPIM